MQQTGQVTNLEFDRALLLTSGLFDATYYAQKAGDGAKEDPIGHYLSEGWQLGLEPNDGFPGAALAPYFATMGFHGPPALTWVSLHSAGWPVPAKIDELKWLAERFRQSGLLDEVFYREQGKLAAEGIDPAIHYVALGERLGLAPSPRFDPKYYGERYPDVPGAGIHCLRHYVDHGRAEGRQALPDWVCTEGGVTLDPAKENVLLVVHETSRTGAPILGWNIALKLAPQYNLFVVRLGGGDLLEEFEAVSVEVRGPAKGLTRNEIDIRHALSGMLSAHRFRYAIVNSAEGRQTVELLARHYIPTLLLMHEFGSYVNPVESLRTALDWATEIVFPSRIVARAAAEAHPILAARQFRILAQGMSVLPEAKTADDEVAVPDDLESVTRMHAEGTFVVLGAGSVQIRKGVDVFLAVAAAVQRKQAARPVHFLWVGDGYKPDQDMAYSVYLREQLNRSDLKEHVTFMEAVTDLEPVYQIADAFLLSSRLDPMPNVSIDSAIRGVPIICFREASGTAEVMLTDTRTAIGVVEHLDAAAAAQVILQLAGDESKRQEMSAATKMVAHASFNMGRYVATLDEMGRAASGRMEQRAANVKTLMGDGTFDQDMFLGLSDVVETRDTTVLRYLALAEARGWDDPPVADTALRRPAAGFNPRIYYQTHEERLSAGLDPLADFIKQGKPAGPWSARVLRPDDAEETEPGKTLRMALHAHFFYPELAADFLSRLEGNLSGPDLLISTDKEQKAEQLRRMLRGYKRGLVDVRVTPNVGRDIGPLLTEFASVAGDYDVVGHVHAKRSLFDGNGAMGDRWREFLWQNLLGGQWPMMDRITAAFANDDELGLVFPCDPHLIGWDGNYKVAGELAERMGWTGALPKHFDFPLGTMFWMRRQALQPLLNLHLGWEDYPQEPLANDGTILHALERLTPLASQLAGFRYAVTHVFGCSW